MFLDKRLRYPCRLSEILVGDGIAVIHHTVVNDMGMGWWRILQILVILPAMNAISVALHLSCGQYSASRNPSCRRASMNAIVLLPFRASEKSSGKENRHATSDSSVDCALSDEFLTDDVLF